MKFCGEERFPQSIDDIMDWFYSFPEESRKSGKWEFSHVEFLAIVKMRDGVGQYFYDILRRTFLGLPVLRVEEENEFSGK